uniref:5-formyltetrahydrofolate cyclo-ligase n=1 Tax=Vaginimicrobium propionicum TaxID=1871034 RepID=UPI00097082D5|nr:5-formyltetrahydrofolate cyclo-ligase [Vaginimicrobium propionicum]
MSLSIVGHRAEVRAQSRAAREKLSDSWHIEANQQRTQFLRQVLAKRKHVASYLSIPPEPDTITFVESWSYPVLVPALKHYGHTKIPQWAPLKARTSVATQTVEGWHGIPEPTTKPVTRIENVDAIVVSALAVDSAGNRIGTGGGWFDRALANLKPSCLKVCLVNSFEVMERIVPLAHDIPVDVVITELGIMWANISTSVATVPARK